jgi:hypothetical protein
MLSMLIGMKVLPELKIFLFFIAFHAHFNLMDTLWRRWYPIDFNTLHLRNYETLKL